MAEITNKKFFTNYAFFLLILLVVFGILIYPSIVSKKSWNNNLRVSVQNVLDESQNGIWKVGAVIDIDKPIATSCAAYNITNKTDNSKASAVIIRITTLYGPLPAVFIYNNDEVTFAGYSSLHGRVKNQLMAGISDKRREYWQKKIPDILNQPGVKK